MSYFLTLVFTKKNGKTVEELLAPFDRNIKYAPYVLYTKEQAIAKIRKDIEACANGWYAEYLADPKIYEKNCDNKAHLDYIKNEFPKRLNWTDDECYEEMKSRFDEDMVKPNGDLLSTYNPNAKWDYYTISGIWDKCLHVNKTQVNKALAKNVNWEGCIPVAFITPTGEWHENNKEDWWTEEGKRNWETEFKRFISNLSEDIMVTVVDCHM